MGWREDISVSVPLIPRPTPLEIALLGGALFSLVMGRLMLSRMHESDQAEIVRMKSMHVSIPAILIAYYGVYQLAFLLGSRGSIYDSRINAFFIIGSLPAQLVLSQWLLRRVERIRASPFDRGVYREALLSTPLSSILGTLGVGAPLELLKWSRLLSRQTPLVEGFALVEHASYLSWWMLSIATIGLFARERQRGAEHMSREQRLPASQP